MTEEKEAIDFLKIFSKTEIDYCKLEKADVLDILNLIDRQQKEIEQQAKEIERKDRNIHKLNLDKIQQQKEIEEFKGIKNGTTIMYKSKAKYVREDKINKFYINKNIIREKIRQVENGTYDAKIILEHLLNE